MKIDKTDLLILDILKKDSKMSTREISKQIRKPITTIHNRIKKLKQEEVIKNYTVVLDEKKLGKFVDAFILVNVAYENIDGVYRNQEEIARDIKKLPSVEEVCIITGINDLIVRVKENEIDTLNDFLINSLRKVQGVEKTQTAVILKSIS